MTYKRITYKICKRKIFVLTCLLGQRVLIYLFNFFFRLSLSGKNAFWHLVGFFSPQYLEWPLGRKKKYQVFKKRVAVVDVTHPPDQLGGVAALRGLT